MTSKNESLFDGNEEKKLSEIDQLVVYATHVQVHQRHMAVSFIVNNLLILCKHDIKKLFVVIDTLQKDQAISVRALLAEKLYEIGSYFSGHSKLGRYITSDLYDIIYKSLTDCSSQVRRACYDSVFNLLNVNSIPHSLVEKTLFSVVLESTAAENDDELRADGISFLMGLAPYMDNSTLMSTVLPLFLQLTSDPSFHVRRACASCFSEMCKLVGTEASEMLMLEKFSNLCEDNVWGVRKACLTSFAGVAESLGATLRSNQLTELYLKLLEDQSRWVRLMAYQVLGEFIATFRFDKSMVISQSCLQDATEQEALGDLTNVNINSNFTNENNGVSKASIKDISTFPKDVFEGAEQHSRESNELQIGKINLSFRSDSEGDDQVQDLNKINDNVGLSIQQSLTKDEIININLASENSDEKNIFVSNFNEFVAKMFGDVSCEESDEQTLDGIKNGTKHVSHCSYINDFSDLETRSCDSFGSETNANLISNDQTSNTSNLLEKSFDSLRNEAVDVHHLMGSEDQRINDRSISDFIDSINLKDNICTGTKKSLLRSAPILFLLDAVSVEESDAPTFETALNFGTTHHRVRGKPTMVCFGEEDASNEDCEKEKDFGLNQEDDLMLIEDSEKLETADDFSKTSLSLPEVASRPLSPVTCRTLKAGGSRWCRQTMVYVSSREGYGKMPPVSAGKIKKTCEFKECPVPGKLLDNFLEMSDSYLSELFDSDIQLHCAYCFPAVTLTLGKINWPTLREFYLTIVASTQVKVRRTLSYSIHELAVILGDDIIRADLMAVFDDFCCDVDEVKMGVIEHFYDFIKLLPLADKLKYLDKLPGMTSEDNGRNWRMRDLVIRELEKILDLLTLEQMHNHLMPLVFTLMSDQVAIVRQSSIQLVGKIIFLLSKDTREKTEINYVNSPNEDKDKPKCVEEPGSRDSGCSPTSNKDRNSLVMTEILHQILDELIHRFANSSNFRQRQSFILVCHQLLNIPGFPSAKVFSPNLLNPLLLLHSDAIVNVRITLCRVLYCDFPKIASLEYIRKNPTDLLDPINKLWNDSDPDVHRLAERFLSLVVQ